jgi:hypothetical protein
MVALALLAVPAAAAPDRATIEREADRALGRSHQRALPGEEDPVGDRYTGRREAGANEPRRDRPRRIDRRITRPREGADRATGAEAAPPGPLAGLATMLLWGLVIVAALLSAVAVYRHLAGYTADDEPERPPGRDELQLAAVIERPRDDADELAAQGRFADAIHTLLLRTLHELASQHLVRVTPAMTSREILARVSLLGEAREALAGLIVAVEQTWFGDDVPHGDDYQRCRAQFDRFAAAYRRGVTVGRAAA